MVGRRLRRWLRGIASEDGRQRHRDGRLEDFFDVQATGDGHLYAAVAALPKHTAVERIERAAMTLAASSALVAAARTPANWPPALTITITPEQAFAHGLYHRVRRSTQRRAERPPTSLRARPRPSRRTRAKSTLSKLLLSP